MYDVMRLSFTVHTDSLNISIVHAYIYGYFKNSYFSAAQSIGLQNIRACFSLFQCISRPSFDDDFTHYVFFDSIDFNGIRFPLGTIIFLIFWTQSYSNRSTGINSQLWIHQCSISHGKFSCLEEWVVKGNR